MTNAILLIGPTGSGKTPLGQMLEARGLARRRCLHLDFGELLRRAAGGEGPQTLSREDVEFVRDVLHAGALLENEHFHIARKLVADLLDRAEIGDDDLVVLNGLPRHVDQGRCVEEIFRVTVVVDLVCSGQTVLRRIGTNVAGDRTGRTDDDHRAVENKLALFAERTRPLVDYFRQGGARVIAIPIGPETTAGDAWQALNEMLQPTEHS